MAVARTRNVHMHMGTYLGTILLGLVVVLACIPGAPAVNLEIATNPATGNRFAVLADASQYSAAVEACNAAGGRLAAIKSSSDNEFATLMCAATVNGSSHPDRGCWVDGTRSIDRKKCCDSAYPPKVNASIEGCQVRIIPSCIIDE